MARKSTSVDGFVPRPSNRKVGGTLGGQQQGSTLRTTKIISQPQPVEELTPPVAEKKTGISRAEIDASLNSLNDIDDEANKKHARRKPITQVPKKRKWPKVLAIVLALVFVGIGGFMAYKTIIASSNVFKGNILEVFQNQPLKEDDNGRSNILILGTSEDDPGHEGANLTDSMMIMSIDQKNKNAFMVSIPRDLYVKYGEACNSGYVGKINVYYSCAHGNEEGVEADRAALSKSAEFVGDIFGLDIQYGVNVNYTVMRDLVNAVGGTITVNIEGNGDTPAGIPAGSVMDSNFDWKCGVNKLSRAKQIERCPPRGHFIDYGPGPQQLDAEHALYLAQARGDAAPTWGLAQSNFDREKNQQKIIKALREKAVSAGVLSDFGKVSSIIDSLGNNLRTTFETKEFRTLVGLAKDIDSENIKSISLIDGDNPVMTTDNVNGQSVVVPSAGTYDYSGLRELLQKKFSSNPVVQEEAPIVVLNGSGIAGLAQTEADKLTDKKFTVSGVDNAPEGEYAPYVLYQIGKGNEGTAAALKKLYGVKMTTGKPPVDVDEDVRFVLIIGPPQEQSGSGSNN